MRILFGIGNPGKKYSVNRHNAGFMLLDYFAENHSLTFKPSKFDFYFSEGELSDSSFILVKPTTYVNKSGVAAEQVIKNFDGDIKEFLIVYDDFNIPLASIKIKLSGGDGGHNGLNSIIYQLNSDQFPRLRIGIGNDFEPGRMAEYVLSDFKRKERKILFESFSLGIKLMESFITGGTKKMLDENSKLTNQFSEDKKEI